MSTAKVFMSGRSQAVRLPKEFRFNASEVGIKKYGNSVILYSLDDVWNDFLNTSPVTKEFGESIRKARENDENPKRAGL